MRKLLSLLVAVPWLAAAQGAPVPQDPSYPAPSTRGPAAPMYAPHQQRDSWYIGFGLGWGDGSAKDSSGRYSFRELNGDRDPTRVAMNFKVGKTMSPSLLLGFDITAVRAQASGNGVDSAVQVTNYDAVATWFPYERGLFLRGGAGLSAMSLSLDSGYTGKVSDTYTGVNVLGGVGYAFWLGKQFNLTLNLDLSAQSYSGSNAPDSSRFAILYAGFDWY